MEKSKTKKQRVAELKAKRKEAERLYERAMVMSRKHSRRIMEIDRRLDELLYN